MYLIVGLGNPSAQYGNTRHNIGFDAIDAIAEKYNINMNNRKHKAVYGQGIIAGQKVILAKPQTFMNLSGESIRSFIDYYKIDAQTQLLVLFDDVSLGVGQLRIRKKGSAGGHNGIKNIIAHLNSQDFSRIKIGVGEKPEEMDLADYVLGHFSKEERIIMNNAVQKVTEAVDRIVAGDMNGAMNQYNQKESNG